MKIESNTNKQQMLTQNLYGLVRDVFNRYNVDYSPDGLDANIDSWLRNKKDLLALLRKHPNWNEDELAVVFEVTQIREFDSMLALSARHRLQELADEIINNVDEKESFIQSLYYTVDFCREYVTSDDVVKLIESKSNIRCAVGQKSSRVVNKICKKFGIDRHSEYNARFAILSDALNPVEIKRKALLSIHPCDYLEMSNKSNSWTSCHRLTGEYAAGTLSYMNDGVTMIFYTVDNGVKEVFSSVPKIIREVFCYQNGVLLQSRLYPNSSDEDTRSNFRNIVQAAIAVCENKPNLWTLKKNMEDVEKHVHTYEDSLHYADYEHDQFNPNISLLKEIENVEHNSIVVGNPAYCLECGDELDHESELFCELCHDTFICNDCGSRIDEDSTYNVNGHNYCRDCVEHCEDCGDYFRGDSNCVIDNEGDDIDVCDSCAEKYVPCENCNGYFRRSNLEEFNDYNYCTACLEKVQEENEKEIQEEYESNCSNVYTA